MKILIITPSSSIGGVETNVIEHAKELIKNGHEIVLATPTNILQKYAENIGITCLKLPDFRIDTKDKIKNITQFIKSCSILNNFTKNSNVDVIHAHASSISAWLLGYLVSKKTNKPIVITIHGLHVFEFPAFRLLFKLLYKKTNALIVISDEIKNYIEDNYGHNDNLFVIYNGINLNEFKSLENEEFPDNKKITIVSRLDSEKVESILKILKILPDIIKKYPQIELQIIGDGSHFNKIKKDTNLINEKIDSIKVYMAGKLEPIDVFNQMYSSYIVIGAGRVAIEGMACNKPVLFISPKYGPDKTYPKCKTCNSCFNGVLTSENIEKVKSYNFSGRNCGNFTSKDMIQTLTKLIQDKEFYNKTKELSYRAIEELDITKTTNYLEKVYYLVGK